MASNSSPAMVYRLPGEPAVVINGVIDPTSEEDPPAASDPASKAEPARVNPGFGSWMEGREVRKRFGEKYYGGTVKEFDKEAGWYRVIYDDGDFEDLEWQELEDILVPLDMAIPLKTLAQRVLRKNQKLHAADSGEAPPPQTARKRGRPKGSLNKPKNFG